MHSLYTYYLLIYLPQLHSKLIYVPTFTTRVSTRTVLTVQVLVCTGTAVALHWHALLCGAKTKESHTQNGVSFTKTATAPRGSIITTMIVFVTMRHCRHHHHHLATTSKMMKVMTAMTRTRRDNDNTLNNKPMTMPITVENAMTCRSITTIAVVMTRCCCHHHRRLAPTSMMMTAMATT